MCHRKNLLRVLYPGRKECGNFEELREGQCGWRTEDGDVVCDEGREVSRGMTAYSSYWDLGLHTYSSSFTSGQHLKNTNKKFAPQNS